MTALPLAVLLGGLAFALLTRGRVLRTDAAVIAILVATVVEGVSRLRLYRIELIAPRYWDLAMCCAAALWWVAYRRRRREQTIRRLALPLVAASAATAFSLARGTSAFSLQDALGQARTFALFLVLAALASISLTPQRLQNAIALIGTVVAGYTVLHVMRYGLASAHDVTYVGDGLFTLRAVPAPQALLTLQAAGLLLLNPPGWLSRQLRVAAILLCAGAVVLLQHRSVWLAGVIGLLAIAVQTRSTAARVRNVAITCAVVLLAVLLLAGPAASVREQLASSVDGVTDTSTGTVGARLSSWQVLLDGEFSSASTIDKLVGNPWGYSFDRTVLGRFIGYSPHNHYVSLLLRTGMLGLGAWLLLLLQPVRTLYGGMRRRVPGQTRSVIAWLVATQVVFGVAYTIPAEQGVVLGIALALSRPRPSDGRVPVAQRSHLVMGRGPSRAGQTQAVT